jgi:hypothetical protein
LRELARLRQPQTRQKRPGLLGVRLRCGSQAARQQQLQHHRPAVGLQLQHVFTGERVGCWEKNSQALVNGLAGRVEKRQVGGLARL